MPCAILSTVTVLAKVAARTDSGTGIGSAQTFGCAFGKLLPYALWPVLRLKNCQLSSQPWCECQAVGHFTLPKLAWLVDSCSMLKSPIAFSLTVVLMR